MKTTIVFCSAKIEPKETDFPALSKTLREAALASTAGSIVSLAMARNGGFGERARSGEHDVNFSSPSSTVTFVSFRRLPLAPALESVRLHPCLPKLRKCPRASSVPTRACSSRRPTSSSASTACSPTVPSSVPPGQSVTMAFAEARSLGLHGCVACQAMRRRAD
jgi:hypothetical protein